MRTLLAALIALLVSAVAIVNTVPTANGQTGAGWVHFVDGTHVGEWDRLGDSNWRVEEGALVADKKATTENGYLVSKTSYKDFEIYAEFWPSDDANSGIFIRCSNPKQVSARTCYEVNIFDQFRDPSYGTGAIVYFAEVEPMPKAGGKWNTFEITARGRQITVMLNGQKTADLRNGLFLEGPFALQHAAGAIKWRKVAVRPIQ